MKHLLTFFLIFAFNIICLAGQTALNAKMFYLDL